MPPVGKSGPGMMLMSSSMVSAGFFDQRHAGVDHFAEIVRRNVGRHADRDPPPAPLTKRLGKLRRQNRRFRARNCHSSPGNRPCPCRYPRGPPVPPRERRAFRISIGRRGIARRPSRNCPARRSAATRMEKFLRHANHRVVNRFGRHGGWYLPMDGSPTTRAGLHVTSCRGVCPCSYIE